MAFQKVNIRPGDAGYIAPYGYYNSPGTCAFSTESQYKCTLRSGHTGNHIFHQNDGLMVGISVIELAKSTGCPHCKGTGKIALLISTVPCDCVSKK